MSVAKILKFEDFRALCGDWIAAEVAQFQRAAMVLRQSGLAVEVETGLTDEGDPWAVFCHAETGEVFVHFARIKSVYVVAAPCMRRKLSGRDFNQVIDDFLSATAPAAAHGPAAQRTLLAHPLAALTALVAVCYLSLVDNGNTTVDQAEALLAADDDEADAAVLLNADATDHALQQEASRINDLAAVLAARIAVRGQDPTVVDNASAGLRYAAVLIAVMSGSVVADSALSGGETSYFNVLEWLMASSRRGDGDDDSAGDTADADGEAIASDMRRLANEQHDKAWAERSDSIMVAAEALGHTGEHGPGDAAAAFDLRTLAMTEGDQGGSGLLDYEALIWVAELGHAPGEEAGVSAAASAQSGSPARDDAAIVANASAVSNFMASSIEASSAQAPLADLSAQLSTGQSASVEANLSVPSSSPQAEVSSLAGLVGGALGISGDLFVANADSVSESASTSVEGNLARAAIDELSSPVAFDANALGDVGLGGVESQSAATASQSADGSDAPSSLVGSTEAEANATAQDIPEALFITLDGSIVAEAADTLGTAGVGASQNTNGGKANDDVFTVSNDDAVEMLQRFLGEAGRYGVFEYNTDIVFYQITSVSAATNLMVHEIDLQGDIDIVLVGTQQLFTAMDLTAIN